MRRAASKIWFALLPACTVVVDPEVGAGIGTPCTLDEECQGSTCEDGLCAVRCADTSGCPGGTLCSDGSCQLPLLTAYVYAYDVEQFDFVRAFDLARLQADEIGYVTSSTAGPLPLASGAADAARALIAEGAQVLVATTPSHAQALATVAGENPEVPVLGYRAPSSSGPLISFDARMYQAFYLAGIVAGRTTQSNRLCFVASEVEPHVVASVNAFALGAQRELGAAVTLEVRWLGEPHDTQPKVNGKSRERVFVEEMVAAGCDVVTHSTDNNIPLFAARDLLLEDDPPELWVIGANTADACEVFMDVEARDQDALTGRCRAGTYFNWAPLLTRVFDDVHRSREIAGPILEGLQLSESDSVVGFRAAPGLGQSTLTTLDAVRAELASDAGVGRVFAGPLESTGQCASSPCVAAGATLDDQGLASMCFLVTGIVDEAGAPALVPESGGCAPP